MHASPSIVRPVPRRRLLRSLGVALLVLALPGCAMLGLVYNRLDSIVGFYIEDLVTLTPSQSAQLDRTLEGNLAWHRGSELQRYAAFLRDVATVFEQPVQRAALLEVTQRTEDYWRKIFEQATPGYTALALSFSDAQARELIAGFERKDEDEYREYAARSTAERIRQREKQIGRTLERFTGTLTARQRQLIRDYARSAPEVMDEWRSMRGIWRRELAEALAERRDTPQFRERMRQLIAYPDAYWPTDYRAGVDATRERFLALLVDLDRTLSPAQRASARLELLALAEEIEKLARA